MEVIGIPALVLALVIGLALRYRARLRGNARLRRTLKRYRPYASGGSGLATVTGRAQNKGHLLVSPLSGAEVLGYQLVVLQQRYDRRGNFYWSAVHEASDLADLVVEHEGDTIEVADSRQISILLLPDKVDFCEYDREDSVPVKLKRCLDREAIKLQEDLYDQFLVISAELLVRDLSRVTLFGRVEQLPDAGADFTGYRESRTRPRMTRPPEEPYILTNEHSADLICKRIGSLDPDALRELYLGKALNEKRC